MEVSHHYFEFYLSISPNLINFYSLGPAAVLRHSTQAAQVATNTQYREIETRPSSNNSSNKNDKKHRKVRPQSTTMKQTLSLDIP